MFTRDVLDPAGLRVTIMGLGLFGGGVGVASYFARHGARVTVTDLRDERVLADSVRALSGEGVEFHLGAHRDADFAHAGLVIVNPAVPWDNPFLALARQHGVPLDSEMNLFFKRCPARIVAVSGTNGKTTTAVALGEMLSRTAQRRGVHCWVGGNMGRSLLLDLEHIRADDFVVIEISSFQLDNLGEIGRSPHGAILTNIKPNHLDRHGTMANYAAAKARIFSAQTAGDFTVLNHDDPLLVTWQDRLPGARCGFSRRQSVARGACLRGATLGVVGSGGFAPVLDQADILLPGWFNVENYLAAFAAAAELGCLPEEMAETARTFRGVEHRLQLVCEARGVRYYNDSIATNPDSTLAALDAVRGGIVWLGGGSDKGIPFDELARGLCTRGVRVCVLTGATADAIARALHACGAPGPTVLRAPTFDAAVRLAYAQARPGDAVLMSPACASFDSFRNFVERGECFVRLVGTLTATESRT